MKTFEIDAFSKSSFGDWHGAVQPLQAASVGLQRVLGTKLVSNLDLAISQLIYIWLMFI